MICHFDRREKSFSDPSHALGMTLQNRHLTSWRGTYLLPRELGSFNLCNPDNFSTLVVRSKGLSYG